jgi:transcription factor SFP1
LHYSPTPSDIERVSPVETTPVSSPKTFSGSAYPRKAEREKDLFFDWHYRRSSILDGPSSHYVDSTLLESDLEDTTFPLFSRSPPTAAMASDSNPISINIQRQNSTSPRQQTSNLTSALQSDGYSHSQSQAMNMGASASGKAIPQARKESVSMGGLTPQFGSGAMPISMNGRNQPRRESLAGSMMAGMSWGGMSMSMNSWIRDE